ncbi:MAG TPA: cupin domain-containing protein [Terracidiphilus sp.]|nr:cupin domain-containing protein [Terracidiphilus sp.]
MSIESPIEVSSPVTLENGAFRFLGLTTLIHASAKTTTGAFGLVEHPSMHPGFATPYHVHHREDEAFYIIEGEVAVILNGAWKRFGPGAYVYGPREIPHGFKVVGKVPARMLVFCTPGGFENFVLGLGQPLDDPPAPPDMSKLIAAAARAGIDILGPLPEDPV